MIWTALIAWPLSGLGWLISQLPAFTAPDVIGSLDVPHWTTFLGYTMTIMDPIVPLDFAIPCLAAVLGVGVAIRAYTLIEWVYRHLPVIGNG